MDKYDFIKMILKRRDVSVNDKKRGVLLATQELEQNSSNYRKVSKNIDKNKEERMHAPKDTAKFLSLFEERAAFKYLTHDFDSDTEIDYNTFLSQVREKFKEAAKQFTIPSSLYATMDVFLNGGTDKNGQPKTWKAWNDKNYTENYASQAWEEWIKQNPGKHPTKNAHFNEVIMDFRSTIRLIKPELKNFIEKKKYPNLCITVNSLENADFYTNVLYLERGIGRILSDMQRYQDYNKVEISFSRDYESEPAKMIITITQVGSETTDLENVVKRFDSSEAGSFNTIFSDFVGYCNWSVEALWNGKPKRWNILKDDGNTPKVEDITNGQIKGFTHILTYYKQV